MTSADTLSSKSKVAKKCYNTFKLSKICETFLFDSLEIIEVSTTKNLLIRLEVYIRLINLAICKQ